MSELIDLQRAFAAHLRNPEKAPIPAGIDPRRMRIYTDLVFGNLSALLSDFFPVIRSILNDKDWRNLVRDFFIAHQAETPYFPKVSEEFVHYLAERPKVQSDPKFLLELAHYEWIEQYLYLHEETLPKAPIAEIDLLARPLKLSPVAVPLAYDFPVQRIRPDFQPNESDGVTTFLLVFRDITESVRFFELQPFAYQLFAAINENPGLMVREWLEDFSAQYATKDVTRFITSGFEMLKLFNQEYILAIKD